MVLRYRLSYWGLVEMLKEFCLFISYITIIRWIYRYESVLEKRFLCHFEKTKDSWCVDETFIKVNGNSMYLYHDVDSEGNNDYFYLKVK